MPDRQTLKDGFQQNWIPFSVPRYCIFSARSVIDGSPVVVLDACPPTWVYFVTCHQHGQVNQGTFLLEIVTDFFHSSSICAQRCQTIFNWDIPITPPLEVTTTSVDDNKLISFVNERDVWTSQFSQTGGLASSSLMPNSLRR